MLSHIVLAVCVALVRGEDVGNNVVGQNNGLAGAYSPFGGLPTGSGGSYPQGPNVPDYHPPNAYPAPGPKAGAGGFKPIDNLNNNNFKAAGGNSAFGGYAGEVPYSTVGGNAAGIKDVNFAPSAFSNPNAAVGDAFGSKQGLKQDAYPNPIPKPGLKPNPFPTKLGGDVNAYSGGLDKKALPHGLGSNANAFPGALGKGNALPYANNDYANGFGKGGNALTQGLGGQPFPNAFGKDSALPGPNAFPADLGKSGSLSDGLGGDANAFANGPLAGGDAFAGGFDKKNNLFDDNAFGKDLSKGAGFSSNAFGSVGGFGNQNAFPAPKLDAPGANAYHPGNLNTGGNALPAAGASGLKTFADGSSNNNVYSKSVPFSSSGGNKAFATSSSRSNFPTVATNAASSTSNNYDSGVKTQTGAVNLNKRQLDDLSGRKDLTNALLSTNAQFNNDFSAHNTNPGLGRSGGYLKTDDANFGKVQPYTNNNIPPSDNKGLNQKFNAGAGNLGSGLGKSRQDFDELYAPRSDIGRGASGGGFGNFQKGFDTGGAGFSADAGFKDRLGASRFSEALGNAGARLGGVQSGLGSATALGSSGGLAGLTSGSSIGGGLSRGSFAGKGLSGGYDFGGSGGLAKVSGGSLSTLGNQFVNRGGVGSSLTGGNALGNAYGGNNLGLKASNFGAGLGSKGVSGLSGVSGFSSSYGGNGVGLKGGGLNAGFGSQGLKGSITAGTGFDKGLTGSGFSTGQGFASKAGFGASGTGLGSSAHGNFGVGNSLTGKGRLAGGNSLGKSFGTSKGLVGGSNAYNTGVVGTSSSQNIGGKDAFSTGRGSSTSSSSSKNFNTGNVGSSGSATHAF